MIFLVECVILCVLFTIPLMIMSKNPLSGINNYPPAIIRRVRKLGLIVGGLVALCGQVL